jgi:hypothetical protein
MTKLNRGFNKETRETGFSSAPELPVHACAHHMKLLRLGKPLCIPNNFLQHSQADTAMPNCAYCFGDTRVATLAFITLTVLLGFRSCGITTAKFPGQAVTFRSSPTVFADTPMSGSAFTGILFDRPPRTMSSAAALLGLYCIIRAESQPVQRPTRVNCEFCNAKEMSGLGHQRTFALQRPMSALPPKADMCSALTHVCFGPKRTHAPQQIALKKDRQLRRSNRLATAQSCPALRLRPTSRARGAPLRAATVARSGA